MRHPTQDELDLAKRLHEAAENLIRHYRENRDAPGAETVKDTITEMLDTLNIGICEGCGAAGEATSEYYCAERRCADCVRQDEEDEAEEARDLNRFRIFGWQ